MDLETVRLPARDTRDRRLVPEHPDPGFEGGQMPLYRRIPKRGFTEQKFQGDRRNQCELLWRDLKTTLP